jgi:hypothetical protein
MTQNNAIVLFKEQQIRRIWHKDEWWFSVVDVVGALTESPDAGAYWRKLKQRLNEEDSEVVTFCHGLKLPAPDGKMRETDCANSEALLRIIQSVPSPKAEPFILSYQRRLVSSKKVSLDTRQLSFRSHSLRSWIKLASGMTTLRIMAGTARKETEKELGRSVISGDNYLAIVDLKKLKK